MATDLLNLGDSFPNPALKLGTLVLSLIRMFFLQQIQQKYSGALKQISTIMILAGFLAVNRTGSRFIGDFFEFWK